MDLPDLSDLVTPAGTITVRVTPGAACDRIARDGEQVRIHVTTVPEAGKATAAARRLLAKALGVAPTRLELLRGATSRDKVFRIVTR